MIAVAKGLLGGLDTAVAGATRKDGATTPPFADTFQQVSADQGGGLAKVVTQRIARASSGGKKASSSSLVELPDQAAGAEAGKSASTVKTKGKTPTAVVDTGAAEAGGGQEVADAVKAATASGGQVGQVGAAAPEEHGETKSLAPTLRAAEESAAGSTIRVNVDVSPTFEVAASSLQGGVMQGPKQALGNFVAAVPVGAAQSRSGSDDVVVGALSTVHQVAEGVNPTATGSEGSANVSSEDLTAALTGSLDTEGPSAGGNASVQSASAAVRGTASTVAGQDGTGPTAPTGSFTRGVASSLPPLASALVTKASTGLTDSKAANPVVAHPLKEQVSSDGAAPSVVPLNALALPRDASAVEGSVVTAQVNFDAPQLSVPEAQATQTTGALSTRPISGLDGSSSAALAEVVPPVLPTSIRLQASRAVTTTDSSPTARKASDKQEDAGQTKDSSEVTATPIATMVVAAPNAAILPMVQGTVSDRVASAGEDAARGGPLTMSLGRGLSAGPTSSVAAASLVGAPATVNAVPVTAGPANTSTVEGKDAAPGLSHHDATAVEVESAPEPGSAELVLAGAQMDHAPGSHVPLDHEAVVAAATSMVKSGQPLGNVSSSASPSKERKAATGDAKPGDVAASSAPTEAARTASVAHPSPTLAVGTKQVSGETQTAVAGGGQTPVPQVAGVGVVASPASVAPALAPVAAQQSASPVGGSDLSMSTATATSPMNAPLGDHALSPMTHTTLSASPTVLEVGVPGGTQGWLKIRAEIGEGGVVQALMSASTHAGQDALRRDLPAISAFLESEHVPVNLQMAHSVAASVAEAVGTTKSEGFDLGSSLGRGLNQNTNSQSGSGQSEAAGMLSGGNGNGQSSNQQQDSRTRTSEAGVSALPTRDVVSAGNVDWTAPAGYGSGTNANGGGWLNVIA